MSSAGDYGSAGSLTPEQAQLCTARFLEQLDALREAGTVLPLDELIKDTTYQTATLTVLALRYYGIPARYAEGFVLTQETAARAQAGSAITLTAADAQGLGRGLSGRHRLDAAGSHTGLR